MNIVFVISAFNKILIETYFNSSHCKISTIIYLIFKFKSSNSYINIYNWIILDFGNDWITHIFNFFVSKKIKLNIITIITKQKIRNKVHV